MKKLVLFTLTLFSSTLVWADILEPPFWRTTSVCTGLVVSGIGRIINPLQFESYIDIWTCVVMVVLVLFIWKRKSRLLGKFLKWFLICIVLFPILLALLLDVSDFLKIGNAIKEIKYQIMCGRDKPLFDGRNCYSCDNPEHVIGRDVNCEVCSNRESTYECGTSCILKNAPGPNYRYKKCRGWVQIGDNEGENTDE